MGISKLWLLVASMLWVLCWSGQNANGQTVVGLTLNGVSYPNHGIVDITEIGTGSAALHCTTTLLLCCFSGNGGGWFLPNGNVITNGVSLPYYRTRTQNPGALLLHRNPVATTTGIFRCDIPVTDGFPGDTQSLYVGVYTSTTGTLTVTALVYNETTRSLTCTSSGGPATTVTWRKDGAVITLNATYQQTQVVTDPVTGTYQNVLTIDQSVTDIFATYSCTVGNTRGTSAAVETTLSSLRVSITPGANPTAGQSYTFTCTVTQGGLTGTPTVQWSRLGIFDPITTGGSFTVSSTPPYTLTINPLRQSYDGQYTCQATVGNTTASSSATLTVAAPSVSVVITPTGTAVVGQSYSLICSVSGADSLSPTSTTYHWYNESSNPRSQVGTTSTYSFTRLRPYHAGQYTCEVTIASPYLNGDLIQSMMQDITVQIPVPTVDIFPPGGASAYAGSQLTLTCSIVLDSTLFFILGNLVVASMWSDPGGGMLSSDGRVTVSPASQQGISTTFISTVMFNTLRTTDDGTYTCKATVAPRGSTAGTVTNGVRSATGAAPTIYDPTIQVDLTSNTTRLPNMAPYNTFFLTCTATIPQGVVSPKTFSWRRRIGASTEGLTDITDNGDSILITSTNLDQPTSTSVLTVRETTAGDYRYCCRVDLNELTVVNTADVYPITVTGPANPVQPQNLMNISTHHDRATVQWSVPYIAYTAETYTVNYVLTANSLGMLATATLRGDNFTIPSQPFMFSAELTGLDPGVTYHYQVEARNSVGPTLSAVQQFTSAELRASPPTNFSAQPTSPTSIRVSWNPPASGPTVVGYRIYYQAEGSQDIHTDPSRVDIGASATQHTLSALQGGIWYIITMVTKSQYLPSNVVGPVNISLRASSPTDLSAEPASPTSIKVSWTPPVPLTTVAGYQINYQAEGGKDSPMKEGSVDIGANATQHILSDLQEGLWYTITMFAKSQSTVSGPVIVTLAMVRVKVVNATAFLVSWDALRNAHHYTIYYSAFSPELFKVVEELTMVVPSTRTSDIVVIRELAAEVEHQFQVTASLVVQGEMYESGKSIPRKIVIDEAAFHLQIGPVSPCTAWSTEKAEEIRSYVHSGIAKAISYHCNCSFPVSFIRNGLFRCWKAPDEFAYRSAIVGIEAHNATELVEFLEEWVNSEPTLQVDQIELWVDTRCPVPIPSLTLRGEGRCS